MSIRHVSAGTAGGGDSYDPSNPAGEDDPAFSKDDFDSDKWGW